MILPLDMLKNGEVAEVASVEGDAAWVGRMAELGVREGCKLQVLQSGSTCLLKISDCRLCIRSCDKTQILVRPVSGPVA
ncbi:MAG: FeoA family protein [Gemmataceae bacterium]